MKIAKAIAVSALLLATILLMVPADAGSDAASSDLMSISLFDSQGNDALNRLMDGDSIGISTHKDNDTGITTYSIDAGTPLISHARYLRVNSEYSGDCILTLTASDMSGFLSSSGLTVRIYSETDPNVSYTVSFTKDSPEAEGDVPIILTAGTTYRIQAWTSGDYPVTDIASPSQFGVTLNFDATHVEEVNALYYHENYDENTVHSKLVANGYAYGQSPNVERAGYTLMGWFTDPAMGDVVKPEDIVNLTGAQHLYAHWLKNESEAIHIDEDGNELWIHVDYEGDGRIHVTINGESDSTRVVTTYSDYVTDGKIIVDTHNTGSDFRVKDATDANTQYSIIQRELTMRGIVVENYIVLRYADSVSCEEGSLAKLLETDCKDFRLVGDVLTISMDRDIIGSLKNLKGETVIEAMLAPADHLTQEQKDIIGDDNAYEIRILNGGREITPDKGTVTAWYEYIAPENWTDMQFYCVNPDGSTERVEFKYDTFVGENGEVNGRVTFKTTHLSIYYLHTEIAKEEAGFNWIPIIIGVTALLLAAAVAFFLYKKRHNRKEPEGAA